MQAARALFSGDHHETAESLKGHGEIYGRGNITDAQRFSYGNKSLFQRLLAPVPQGSKVVAGVGILLAFSFTLFSVSRPGPKDGKVAKTRTPEWEKATEKYLKNEVYPKAFNVKA